MCGKEWGGGRMGNWEVLVSWRELAQRSIARGRWSPELGVDGQGESWEEDRAQEDETSQNLQSLVSWGNGGSEQYIHWAH